MNRAYFAILSTIALTACATNASDDQASGFGVDVDAMGACVKANATASEQAALDAGGDVATQTTGAILNRQSTQDCLEARGVDLSQFAN